MVILHHPLDIQVFYGNYVELPQELQCRFMTKAQALPFDFEILFLQQLHCLLAIFAATFLAGHVALCGFQSLLSLAQMLRVRNRRPSAESSNVFQSYVKADSLPGGGKVGASFAFNTETDVPAIGFTLDCTGLNRVCNRTAQDE